MRYVLCVASILILFQSCTKDPGVDEEVVIDEIMVDEEPLNENHFCTELYSEAHLRAFGSKSLFWEKKILTVRFLEGSDFVQGKVRYFANQWSQYAGITFQFIKSGPSDIRISFDQSSGSWSYVGQTNAYIASTRATMNFGWFNSRTSDTEFRRTTMHEFGHALGLSHEHQHPEADINWNVDAVYAYYARTQEWSRSQVNSNIFRKYSASTSNYSAYDPASIMHYYIPRSLVNGTWTPRSNSRVSGTDIAFMGAMYPKNGGGGIDVIESCSCPDDLVIIACDDFETYTSSPINASDDWYTWSPESGTGEFQTYNWGKVLKMQYNADDNPDVLYAPEVSSTAVKTIAWEMYVRKNKSAYFNIQKSSAQGEEFGAQVYFNSDSTGVLHISDQKVEFNYVQDDWNDIKISMDFEQDQMVFLINENTIASWPLSWSAQTDAGTRRFGAVNFYAADEEAQFWLDNFCVSTSDAINADAGMDLVTAGTLHAIK